MVIGEKMFNLQIQKDSKYLNDSGQLSIRMDGLMFLKCLRYPLISGKYLIQGVLKEILFVKL